MAPVVATPAPVSKLRRWSGRILSVPPVLFLLFDATIKLLQLRPVDESFARLGYPVSIAPALGTLELVCLALYVVPLTSPLGAILLTGFLGGATATHVRVGDPLFTHVLFPAYVGVLLWAGSFLRDRRVRALVLQGASSRRSSPRASQRAPETSSRVDLAEARST